jgi:hypothetical protein
MSISGTGANSASLMSWLITHNNELNNSLDDAMHQGDVNVGVQKDLKDLQDKLKDPTKDGLLVMSNEIQDFIDKYHNDPNCASLLAQMREMKAGYDKAVGDKIQADDSHQKGTIGDEDWQKQVDGIYNKLSGYPTQIETQLDAMKKMDELQMTRINDLSSQRSQAFQLASNMMASGNQVLSGMINNIKG